jgi:tetratricopeptide (TPR) repeat protein
MAAPTRTLALISALAISAAPVVGAPAVEADWLQLKKAADNAYAANNYGVAERTYLEALKKAEGFGNADLRLADTLHQLVALYSTRAQFTKAEPMFERELRVREKALGGEHPEVVATVGKLAQFYIDHGSPAKAERLTRLLVGFADRKLKEQQSVKDEFARLKKFYDKSKDYAESAAILKKLEESTAKTTANQDLELATTMDMLGRLYQSRNEFSLAEKLFRNSLLMREKTLSPAHLALAQSYENLAALYTLQGKQDQAQALFKQSLDVTEKTLQPGRMEFFSRLDQLAKTYASTGHGAEAESLYKRGLALIDKTSPNSYDAGRASLALGTLYLKQGRFAAAEPLLKRALKVSEGANGPEHAAVAPILDSYADVLDKLGKSGEAARMRARARAIRGVQTAALNKDSDF